MDLRCGARLHGIVEGNFIDIVCKSRFCGAERGAVVVHRFNVNTGELVRTDRFRKVKGN